MLRSNDLHEAIDPERFYIFPTAGGDSKQEFSESSLVLQLEVFSKFSLEVNVLLYTAYVVIHEPGNCSFTDLNYGQGKFALNRLVIAN